MEYISASASASASAPFLDDSMTTIFSLIPSTLQSFSRIRIVFFTILIINISSTSSLIPIPNPESEALYAQQCDHIVPKSPLDSNSLSSTIPTTDFELKTGYFSGGDRLLGTTSQSGSVFSKYVSFRPFYVRKTVSGGVFKVQGSLHIRGSTIYSVSSNSRQRRLRLIRFRGPKILPRKGSSGFALTGYWSESSGKLCMIGSGTGLKNSGSFHTLSVVFKLNYPKNASILTSLITGTLESLDDEHSLNSFEPISILGLSQNTNYDYTLVDEETEKTKCLTGNMKGANLTRGVCSMLGYRFEKFDLEYESDCESINCNPLGRNVQYLPHHLFFHETRCMEEGNKLQMLLTFTNSSYNSYRFPFEPSTTLIAEGKWDPNENRLCAVGCRILNFTDSLANAFVGDCSIKFSLIFPANLSIRNRNTIVGKVWSNKSVNELGYFGGIGFQSYQDVLMGPLNIKYNYTEADSLKSCANDKTITAKGKTYPNGYSFDMRFDMSVRNRRWKIAHGYSSPLFVGDQLFQNHHYGRLNSLPWTEQTHSSTFQLKNNLSSILSISYIISFTAPRNFKLGEEDLSLRKVEVSAEGSYDTTTGFLCMTGCLHRRLQKNVSMDCEMVIRIQFPPLDASGGDLVRGTIESKRSNSDPLHFERLKLLSDSIYMNQAKKSIWRMDLEIAMVLVSYTLACLFMVLQLLYVKNHPDVIPFISISMLIVLTIGYMVPLLLNFSALFVPKHNGQNMILESGGWLEVNEVIVRVVTMVAFLLQLHLLQLTWSGRGKASQKSLWDSEQKVIYITLPLYISGILATWFVHRWKSSYTSSYGSFLRPHRIDYQLYPTQHISYSLENSFWVELKSYAGLVLDGFLLPQILFNLISDPKQEALSALFYFGFTILRLLPHAYDLYRAHNTSWYLDLSYIYADHNLDFYSTAWDIFIPCTALLFAVLVFLQQRYGGRFILPQRFRVSEQNYEKVPVIGNEEL